MSRLLLLRFLLHIISYHMYMTVDGGFAFYPQKPTYLYVAGGPGSGGARVGRRSVCGTRPGRRDRRGNLALVRWWDDGDFCLFMIDWLIGDDDGDCDNGGIAEAAEASAAAAAATASTVYTIYR